MFRKILLLFACLAMHRLQAQTMVTDMGTIMYYNSLDSAKSAILNRIAARAYCLLQFEDSAGTIHLKLDLDLSRDSTYYFLSYDNLAGTAANLTDSALATAPKMDGDLGLYIRARDSTLDEDKILRLIDYGVRNYAELKCIRLGAPPLGLEQIAAIFQKKITPKMQRWIKHCK